jgi:uncharacterized protein
VAAAAVPSAAGATSVTHFVHVLAQLARRAPAVVLVLVLVLTGGLGFLAGNLETAAGNEGFAPDNPELEAAEILGDRFGEGGEEVMQVLLSAGDDDLVSARGVAAVIALRAALADSDVADDLSERPERPAVVTFLDPLFQAAEQAGIDPTSLGDDAVEALYLDAVEALPAEQAGFLTALQPDDTGATDADALLVLLFVDRGGITGDANAQFDALIEVESSIAAVVRDVDLPDGVTAEPFSFALLFADTDEFEAELARLFGAAFGIIVLILGFVFWVKPAAGSRRIPGTRRTVADVLLTMATIIMAILWMQGGAYLLGPDVFGVIGRLTEVTQILPVLLIGLGVDYSIHLTSRYREEIGGGASTGDAVGRAVHTVGIALVLATATTAVGFLTNIVNPVPALRDFGIVAAVGILASFILMLTFVPAARLLLDRRAEGAGRLQREALGKTSERFLPGIMARTAILAERGPIPTLLVTVLIGGALGLWGLSNLETRFSSTDFVPDDSPIVATFDTIVERFGGGFGEETDVLLRGDVGTVASHNALVEAQGRLADVDDVATFDGNASAESPVSVLAQLVAPGPDGAPLAPPVAQLAATEGLQPDLTFAEGADVGTVYRALLEAAPDLAGRVIALDDAGAVELLRVGIQTTAGEGRAAELAEDVRGAFAPVEATGVEAIATSNPIINDVIVSALQDSQVSSLGVTLLAAMLLLVATFGIESRRPFLGVITIAPVALVVLWTFGMMALTGIPFGPVTATIAALAIGIGVPYTIHITHRYTEDRLRYADPAEAIRSTVRHTGGALAGSAFTTMAGFGVLVTSSLTPFRHFGLVTAYAIGFALLAATIVLPSMLTLWDRWHRRKGDAVVAEPTADAARERERESAGV